jgi:hypothetical protein
MRDPAGSVSIESIAGERPRSIGRGAVRAPGVERFG